MVVVVTTTVVPRPLLCLPELKSGMALDIRWGARGVEDAFNSFLINHGRS